MAELEHDLPEGMFEWIAETGGGEVTRLKRHVARREAWIVDVTRPDGSVLEGFLPAFSETPEAKAARERNRVSYELSPRGINLPSAMKLTESQVDRVCSVFRSILEQR